MIRVMTAKYVYRYKGTLVQGVLEAPVRVGQTVHVGDRPSRIMHIEVGLLESANEAPAGAEVVLGFWGLGPDVRAGCEVTLPARL